MHDGAVVKGHIVVEQFLKSSQLFFVGKLSGQQHLLKTASLLLKQRFYEVHKFVASIVEFALCWAERSIRFALVAHHITYIGESNEHACAVVVAQSALHAILGKELIVYLARVFNLVGELVYQIFFVHWALFPFLL